MFIAMDILKIYLVYFKGGAMGRISHNQHSKTHHVPPSHVVMLCCIGITLSRHMTEGGSEVGTPATKALSQA